MTTAEIAATLDTVARMTAPTPTVAAVATQGCTCKSCRGCRR